MSLVGPGRRCPPRSPQFDRELGDRVEVQPGITGLWQVEARDNPSFEAYRRLDLFYVENWSVSLDMVILLATVEQLAAKTVTMVARKVLTQAETSRGARSLKGMMRTAHGTMARLRVGTDLVRVADIGHSIEQFGDRYLTRVYTADELSTCRAVDGRSNASLGVCREGSCDQGAAPGRRPLVPEHRGDAR